jgi:polar amino acid transport system permease protein
MAAYLGDFAGGLGEVLPGVGYTVLVTAAAFAIGAALGVPLVLMRRSRPAVVRGATRLAIDVIRSVPPIAWLFLIFFGLPSVEVTFAPLTAAILGLGLISAAYMAEIYRGGLMSISPGQWEAGRALGFGERDLLLRVVAPQAARAAGPPAATYAIGLLKDSAIVSTIGVVELTFRANAATEQGGNGLDLFLAAGVIYLILSLPLAVVSRHVDRRLRARFSLA